MQNGNTVDSHGSSHDAEFAKSSSVPCVVIEAAETFNYAAWQNAVPLLRSVSIDNTNGTELSSVTLQLSASPAFAREKRWVVDRVRADEVFSLSDIDLDIDPDYLNRLDEAERGVLTFRLLRQGEILAETTHRLRVLARDEWGGVPTMAELLPAFVTPNDPALAPLLKSAATLLGQHGHSTALDGYQSGDPNRAYLLAASMWSAIAGRSLTYANPPGSFEQIGQKTRRVATVLSDGLATCLDTTLLFASALEGVGLNPVLVLTKGHCFAGVWLVNKTLKRLVDRDCSELRKAIAAKELVVFETTMVTHQPPGRFPDAVATATSSLTEAREREFVATVDVSRARMSQILPLASHGPRNANVAESGETGPPPLPSSPGYDCIPAAETEERPQTPAGRIDRWQRKLLDLSLRNPLLNFRLGKQAIPVHCPNVSQLEDRLAAGARMRLISLADSNPIGERDAKLHHKRTQKDLELEFASQALERDEVVCPVADGDLNVRLTALYRKARNDLAEGGSNTLYLAVGFLRWKQNPTDEKTYRAPLLLVPVKLTRRSASSPYYLANHEDDVRFNATLLQLLKKDFDCDLTTFESNLPTDDSGVDVPTLLERMRRAVRDIPGFEVVEEAAIAPFSFAKYLMWKDLVDRVGHLDRNRVVRHLIHEPDKVFSTDGLGPMPRPHEIDTRYTPTEIVHPLPADSSQLAAVMAASEGHDLVIVGPPGTGKSQTIANLIAQCLAVGKTVLFVAEKTAALDVVHRRLREHGLGECCVELHSNKAERRRFLDQLEASWTSRAGHGDSDWVTVSERLRIRRDELNTYAAAVHTPAANGWTAYRAMGVCVRGRNISLPQLNLPASVHHDGKAYESLRTTVEELASTFEAVPAEAALPRVQIPEWSMAWESSLLESCGRLKEAATAFAPVMERFAGAIGLQSRGEVTIELIGRMNRLAQALVKSATEDVSTIFHKQFARFPGALAELRELRRRHEAAIAAVAGSYIGDGLAAIPIDDLDRQWREANAAFWPMSWLARRKVTRLLQSFAKGGCANPATDLSAIRELQTIRSQLDANPLTALSSHWKGFETDTDAVDSHLALGAEARAAILELGQPLGATSEISRSVLPALRATSGNHSIVSTAAEQLRRAKAFTTAWRAYQQAAGVTPVAKESSAVFQDAIAQADQVLANRTLLKQWTAWVAVRSRAKSLGLGPFVEALQAGELTSGDAADRFELAYARWWLPAVVDRSEPLRAFQRFRHEDAIRDFKRLDDLARCTASVRVRQAVFHGLPPSDQVPRQSELGLLRHQMGLKRPSKTIREVITGMPETFGKLAPCLLMSPLSIAQYLPANHTLFDVVVFDEASQIATWDAIGAIARGKQTIIVGDPKQLPPTNFFGKADSDDNDDLEDYEKDLESILDEAQASGLPTLQLNWHYRSRHESLIAFSNWNYYGNQLVTFPAAESADRGVSLKHVERALYDRGKSRTNRKEAEAIIADLVARMKRCLAKPEGERLTYGVVTFNSQQQELLQDLLDQSQRECPELEWFFSDDRIEPTAVKNLENVQGDERDVMMFSITFGFDVHGKFPVDFGAINREGGERRLNVAVTRARQELVVYASFLPDQLRAERSSARGIHDLKAFLEYSDKGPKAIAARIEGSLGGYESPLEEAVAAALQERGWRIDPQVGVSGFRVDLGVVHPDKLGAYLAGVECDGATYHRSAVARDRDKIRQQTLENLGWNILRVWSTDWWYDPKTAIEQLHAALSGHLNRAREDAAASAPSVIQVDRPSETRTVETDTKAVATLGNRPTQVRPSISEIGRSDGDPQEEKSHPQLIAQQAPQTARHVYVRAELADATANQDHFFDDDYSDTLREMAMAVLKAQGPIRDDALARELARAHGFGRTANRIKVRVLDLLSNVTVTDESVGRFLWADESPPRSIAFRYSANDDERRSLDEIAMAELIGLVRARPDLAASDDPALAFAREIGLARLANTSRSRLEEALAISAERGVI